MKKNKVSKSKLSIFLTTIAILLIILSISLLSNEYIIKPMKSKTVIEKSKQLYHSVTETDSNQSKVEITTIPNIPESSNEVDNASEYDAAGRLKEFSDLLNLNPDVKGWLSIPDTNIDYPVLQSIATDPEYYLTRNINKELDKMGSIFIDIHSSVEEKTKNLVIHGHNMTSTDNMFHYLLKYNSIDYYKEHPLIKFDSIYDKGTWKIISIFKANANITPDFFNYTKSTFKDDAEYLEFIYQLRARSIYNLPVDINETDPILCLSTCSYELDNYRTVIVARKVREDETQIVDTKQAVNNPSVLYPLNWYEIYGGDPPVLATFPEALKKGEISWYRNAK